MSSVATQVSIVVLLTLANGLFSMSEMAVVSSRKVRLQQQAQRGDRRAQAALELANSPNRFLSTVQVGITLIGTITGAFGGAELSKPLTEQLKRVPLIQDYAQPVAFTTVVILLTYLSLIVGELVPKQLALNDPEAIATLVAVPMRFLSKLASPVVHLLSLSTEAVLKLLNVRPSTEPEVTEEEIRVMIQQGTDAGMIEEAEQEMVERVLRFGDRKVSALMTPRPDIVWLDLDDSYEDNQARLIEGAHSRLPVCQEGLDNVLGVTYVNDLLSRALRNQPFDLTLELRQPLFVPENTRSLKVLELFKETGNHMALVVDEYGVIQGLVTLNDILQAIIGDVPGQDDEDEQQPMQREDGSWLLDGSMDIDEVHELLDVDELPGEQRGNYHTLGGFVITYLGRIPKASDHFEWSNLRFEVVDMDKNRVDKVMVSPLVKPEPASPPTA
jgi:putative hemolysin